VAVIRSSWPGFVRNRPLSDSEKKANQNTPPRRAREDEAWDWFQRANLAGYQPKNQFHGLFGPVMRRSRSFRFPHTHMEVSTTKAYVSCFETIFICTFHQIFHYARTSSSHRQLGSNFFPPCFEWVVGSSVAGSYCVTPHPHNLRSPHWLVRSLTDMHDLLPWLFQLKLLFVEAVQNHPFIATESIRKPCLLRAACLVVRWRI